MTNETLLAEQRAPFYCSNKCFMFVKASLSTFLEIQIMYFVLVCLVLRGEDALDSINSIIYGSVFARQQLGLSFLLANNFSNFAK